MPEVPWLVSSYWLTAESFRLNGAPGLALQLTLKKGYLKSEHGHIIQRLAEDRWDPEHLTKYLSRSFLPETLQGPEGEEFTICSLPPREGAPFSVLCQGQQVNWSDNPVAEAAPHSSGAQEVRR